MRTILRTNKGESVQEKETPAKTKKPKTAIEKREFGEIMSARRIFLAEKLATIRRQYGVPAVRGARVESEGRTGVLSGASNTGLYVDIRFDGEQKKSGPYHPTSINYLEPALDVSTQPSDEQPSQSRKTKILGEQNRQ